jgi:predicted NAD/FAD-binding protein
MQTGTAKALDIAVVGSGISGLSAAWLLNQKHRVTLYEKQARAGGHANTARVQGPDGAVAVDTGFIVYNPPNYPNLTALFEHLGVPTQDSDMSFAVSLDGGAMEYSGSGLNGLFAQRRNLLRPAFWSLLRDLKRFYTTAAADADANAGLSLGDYLDAKGYGHAFQEQHILPMAAAIWSAPAEEMRAYPLAAFVRFFDNHELLSLGARSPWRTVTGGSQAYVSRIVTALSGAVRLDAGVVGIDRSANGVVVRDGHGGARSFDHVVIATHADEALALIDPSRAERDLLGAFRYTRNRAVLHSDTSFMPKRRAAWSSWNYTGSTRATGTSVAVTYWMNSLQSLPSSLPLFVTLNPEREPQRVHTSEIYTHPLFDARAMAAQRELWRLQGENRTWYCGAYFGAGFHEDGLQAGLAVAEQLGGLRRPWTVANESGRIVVGPAPQRTSHLEIVA